MLVREVDIFDDDEEEEEGETVILPTGTCLYREDLCVLLCGQMMKRCISGWTDKRKALLRLLLFLLFLILFHW